MGITVSWLEQPALAVLGFGAGVVFKGWRDRNRRIVDLVQALREDVQSVEDLAREYFLRGVSEGVGGPGSVHQSDKATLGVKCDRILDDAHRLRALCNCRLGGSFYISASAPTRLSAFKRAVTEDPFGGAFAPMRADALRLKELNEASRDLQGCLGKIEACAAKRATSA